MRAHPFSSWQARSLRDRVLAEASGRVVEIRSDGSVPEGPFDTAVSVFTLCVVPSPVVTLTGVRAALAEDGRLLFVEHVRAPGRRGRLQEVAGTAFGCDRGRRTLDAIREAGFVIDRCDRAGAVAGGVAHVAKSKVVA